MKNSIKFLLALFIMSTVFVGCGKDDDEDTDDGTGDVVTVTNYLMIDATKYELNKSYIYEYGEVGTDLYNIDMELSSPGLIYHTSNNDIDSVTGAGNVIYFELFTSNMSILDTGVYTYDENGSVAKTLISGTANIGLNVANNDAGDEYIVASGTFTVISNSTTIEISFNCVGDNGKVIKGQYKGSATSYDFSAKKGKKNRLFL